MADKSVGDTFKCPRCAGINRWTPEKNPPGAKARPGEKGGTAIPQEEAPAKSSSKPPFWIEGQFGLCVYARMPNGSEPCYLNMSKAISIAGIDGAISFLKVLREELDK